MPFFGPEDDGLGEVDRPVRRHHRKPVNMRKKPYVPKIMKRVAEEFGELGWRVVSTDPIEGKLAASTFPLYDLGSLRSGFGVGLERPQCGCRIEISVNGCITPIWECDEANFHPTATDILRETRADAEPVVIGNHMPHRGGAACSNCGETLEVNRRIESISKKGWAEVTQEVGCPHCGNRNIGTIRCSVLDLKSPIDL